MIYELVCIFNLPDHLFLDPKSIYLLIPSEELGELQAGGCGGGGGGWGDVTLHHSLPLN